MMVAVTRFTENSNLQQGVVRPLPSSCHPTVLSSWVLAIAKALEARGCDSGAVFARAGLDISLLGDPEARVPVRNPSRLWPFAVEATGDPCFGLEVARHTLPTTFHSLGFSLAASSTLKEAFERVVLYYRLISDAISIRFDPCSEGYRVSVSPDPRADLAPEAIDAILALGVRLCRSLASPGFAPVRVEMRRSPPPDPSPLLRYFRAPVQFAGKSDAFFLDRAACEQRLPGANPVLARANDLIAANTIERWYGSRLSDRVRLVLIERLPNGMPALTEVARSIGMSPRAMQRGLARENTTYVRMVDQTRRELATNYLGDRRYAMTDITYLLGFAGAAAFSRAFRRWMGRTPSDYRRTGLRV
jgi:AraC-like DNA-binding protein